MIKFYDEKGNEIPIEELNFKKCYQCVYVDSGEKETIFTNLTFNASFEGLLVSQPHFFSGAELDASIRSKRLKDK